MNFAAGDRVVHPEFAFGIVQASNGGNVLVALDNGDVVEAPLHEWEPAFVNPDAVIPLEAMTDEQLDAELERFRTMRQIGVRRKGTRASASREPAEAEKMNQMLKDAESDPELRALLEKIGLKM